MNYLCFVKWCTYKYVIHTSTHTLTKLYFKHIYSVILSLLCLKHLSYYQVNSFISEKKISHLQIVHQHPLVLLKTKTTKKSIAYFRLQKNASLCTMLLTEQLKSRRNSAQKHTSYTYLDVRWISGQMVHIQKESYKIAHYQWSTTFVQQKVINKHQLQKKLYFSTKW